MVRSSVRVPERQRMAWAVALAAGFVASTALLTSAPLPHPRSAASGDISLDGAAASALPAGFREPSRSAPQAGPGITVLASPTSAGTLTVSETIRVQTPITTITLSTPVLPRGFDQRGVAVENVVIVADGRTIVLDFSSLQGQRVVPLGLAASTVTVSYVLSGVAKPGRSDVVALQPIASVGGGVILPVSYVVAAKSTLECPGLPMSAQAACTGAAASPVSMLAGLASTQSTLVINLAPGSTGTTPPPSGGSGTVVAGGPTGPSAGAGSTGSTGSGGSTAGSTGGSVATGSTGDSGSTGSTGTVTAGGDGSAPATAGGDPTTTTPTTSGTPTDTTTPTDTSTTDPGTATGTPTDTSTTSTDPSTTTPTPDPATSSPSPITLPTGTASGSDGSNGSNGLNGSNGSNGAAASGQDASGGTSPATALNLAVTPSAGTSVSSEQSVTGTGSATTGDGAPLVVGDTSTTGPSTESVGASDAQVPTDGSATPDPTDSTPAAGDLTTPATDPATDPTTDPTTAPVTDPASSDPTQPTS